MEILPGDLERDVYSGESLLGEREGSPRLGDLSSLREKPAVNMVESRLAMIAWPRGVWDNDEGPKVNARSAVHVGVT